MQTAMLIVYVKKGAALKPGSLVGDCAERADYVTLPNGDAVGVVHGRSAMARKKLEADPNITVFPPMHRPITAEHAALLSYVPDITAGEAVYDVAEKLHVHHRMPWFHPEEGPHSNSSIADMLPDLKSVD